MYEKLPRFGQHLVSVGIIFLFLVSVGQLILILMVAFGFNALIPKDTATGRTLQTVIRYTIDAPENDDAFVGIVKEVKRVVIDVNGETHAFVHQCIGDVMNIDTDHAYCVGHSQLLYENEVGTQFIIDQKNVFTAPATTVLAWTESIGGGDTLLLSYHETPCPSGLMCAAPGDTTAATLAFHVTEATYIALQHYPNATLLWNNEVTKAAYVVTPHDGAMDQLWGYSLTLDKNELLVSPYEKNTDALTEGVAWSNIQWQDNDQLTATLTAPKEVPKELVINFFD